MVAAAAEGAVGVAGGARGAVGVRPTTSPIARDPDGGPTTEGRITTAAATTGAAGAPGATCRAREGLTSHAVGVGTPADVGPTRTTGHA